MPPSVFSSAVTRPACPAPPRARLPAPRCRPRQPPHLGLEFSPRHPYRHPAHGLQPLARPRP
jgi:hypothetical protein